MLYDELSKGVDCKTRFNDPVLVMAALFGLKDRDAAARASVLSLAKRLAACGAPLTSDALGAAARAADADAFAWLDPLVKNAEPQVLREAVWGGDEKMVARLMKRRLSADLALASAVTEQKPIFVELLWPAATTTARDEAVTSAVDGACRTKDGSFAGTLSALAKLGLEAVPDKLRSCDVESYVAFMVARRDADATRPGTRELDALVWGGDPSSAELWEQGLKALLPGVTQWWRPLGPYPRRVKSDTLTGMNPGFDVVLAGLCPPEQSASRLEALKALYPGAYVKRVSAPAADLGCPVVLEQPWVSATKSAKAGPATLTLSLVRLGNQRTCLATKVGADGALAGFAKQDLELPDACKDSYEEKLDVPTGECAVRCGGKPAARFRLSPKMRFERAR